MPLEPAVRAGRAIGAMSLACFGAVWLAAACLMSVGAQPVILAGIACGAVCICLVARHQLREYRRRPTARVEPPATAGEPPTTAAEPPAIAAEPPAIAAAEPPPGAHLGRAFHIVNAAQWILIAAAAAGLGRAGHPEWIEAAVVAIVGLHFLPLAAVFRHPRLYLTGAAMITLAVVYPLTAADGPASPIGCLGAGLILWASAVADLVVDGTAERAA
ncbi:MAG TPA: hypothetical protein VF192_08240 [Longimicrobiales bacterium]